MAKKEKVTLDEIARKRNILHAGSMNPTKLGMILKDKE